MMRVSVPEAMLAAMLVIGATVVAINNGPSVTADRNGQGFEVSTVDSPSADGSSPPQAAMETSNDTAPIDAKRRPERESPARGAWGTIPTGYRPAGAGCTIDQFRSEPSGGDQP